ncbi:Hpt domain-containing protein [Sulfurimonas sp. C5]|uniref:Hpt domain-containing protein n=1 Tax=Sulfurimonas sp. C5 TaxID=3036947 RepID=UPI002458A630|nr:Hpt domain-containing protein [Sulfurimonas sp. C5]MDH4944569.1 Hpt domain-containing protein [Sulfurimonas sp. C5]
MLIYNYKKEFIGIDEKDLKTLGLETLAQLQAEATDFADLFVKTPGYVHNFQHVHWIDYVSCADSTEHPRVIINVNNHVFKSDVSITTAYLADNPIEKAYFIHLNHLRILTDSEKGTISVDRLDRPSQQTATTPEPISFPTEAETPILSETAPAHEILEDEYDSGLTDYEELPVHVDESPLDVGDLSVDDVIDDSFELHPELASTEAVESEFPTSIEIPESIEVEESTEPVAVETPVKQTIPAAGTMHLDPELEKIINSGYVYNPQIASDELGLPLDLIEEFIEDFISQAKEFKSELYGALDEGDVDTVKILSHKLKGVAANLRIEDALEVLTTINTTGDLNIIKKNLDAFYMIIAKLAGEEINLDSGTPQEMHEEEEELTLDFKDEPEEEIGTADEEFNDKLELPTEADDAIISIADDDVPEQIDIPELADDNFIAHEEVAIDLADEIQSESTEFDFQEPISLEDDTTQEPESVQTYSKEQIAQEIGLDTESLHELLEDFQTEAKDIIATMKTALQNSDLDLLKAQANQLKGMSNNIRFTELSNALQELLNIENVDDAFNMISRVEELLEQISSED